MKFMIVEGKKFILRKHKHRDGTDKLFLIPFEEEKYNKIVDEIAVLLEKVVDRKELLRQSLASLEFDQIEKIHKSLKRGVKPKAKKGCYEIKIGNEYLGIVD